MNGKGDRRRPQYVSDEEFAANWEAVFGPERVLCPFCGQPKQRQTVMCLSCWNNQRPKKENCPCDS